MAKKGAQLQIDVETEEEWEKLVQRDGLISNKYPTRYSLFSVLYIFLVCDVYSDWCGPCTGMSGNLRKLKLEIGGDVLTVATVLITNTCQNMLFM